MVLARQTPLILLDEPTSAHGLGHAVEALELVREVAATGHTRDVPIARLCLKDEERSFEGPLGALKGVNTC